VAKQPTKSELRYARYEGLKRAAGFTNDQAVVHAMGRYAGAYGAVRLSRNGLAHWKLGYSDLSATRILALAAVLGVTVDALLEGELTPL
jgi:transcriptional regulator with XRE-family HTH domain